MELRVTYIRDVQKIGYVREGDAAIDLRAAAFVTDLDGEKHEVNDASYTVQPGERILIKTGVCIALPPGTWGNIRDRSGLAYKHGLHTFAGVIDENFRGEIGVVAANLGKHPITLEKNERIAQMIIGPALHCTIQEVDSLEDTNRQDGAFGSSGRH